MVDTGLVLPAQAHGRERPVLGCDGPHRDDGLAGAPQRVVVAEAVVELAGGGGHHRDVAVGGEPGGADLLDGVVLDPGEPCAIVVAEDAGPVRRGGKRRGRGDRGELVVPDRAGDGGVGGAVGDDDDAGCGGAPGGGRV